MTTCLCFLYIKKKQQLSKIFLQELVPCSYWSDVPKANGHMDSHVSKMPLFRGTNEKCLCVHGSSPNL